MKVAQSFARLAVCLAATAPLASAWPSWFPPVEALVARQNPDPTTSASAPAKTDSSSTGKVNTATTRNLNTASVATDASGRIIKPTGVGAGNSTRQTQFPAQDPVGGVVMVTPAATLGTQLYKIGDMITWKWNYTNLQANPTAVDVLVSCSRASETWTLTSNLTFATEQAYTWDTREQATAAASPLLTEQYTLIVYDAEAGVSATPVAGYLGTFNQFVFGMYTPQPYQPLSEWNCATCNSGALSSLERSALGFAASMSLVTVLSFTWFVTGLGVL